MNLLDEQYKHTVRSVMNDPSGELEPPKKNPATPLERTKKIALDYLKRPHSEKELRKKLADRGCAQEDIDPVVALCVDYGFVNDEEYAGSIVRHYAAAGFGPGRIRAELNRRGVPKELWDQALEQLPDQTDTLDRLLAAKLRGQDPRNPKERDKAAAVLYRKGYGWEEIRAALRRAGADDL